MRRRASMARPIFWSMRSIRARRGSVRRTSRRNTRFFVRFYETEQELLRAGNAGRNRLRERRVFYDELDWPSTPEMEALRQRLCELEDENSRHRVFWAEYNWYRALRRPCTSFRSRSSNDRKRAHGHLHGSFSTSSHRTASSGSHAGIRNEAGPDLRLTRGKSWQGFSAPHLTS